MTSAPGKREGDDVVAMPDVDLDAVPESDSDDEPARPDHAARQRTGSSVRWPWLAIPAVFLAGGLLGAYIADVRTSAESANAVTARLGAFHVAPNGIEGFDREEPVRVDVDILNTSDRDIMVTGVSVPGMRDNGHGAVINPGEAAPGEWVTVTVIETVDCYARDLAPVAMLDVTTNDGSHQVEAIGPPSSGLNLGRTLQVVCSSRQDVVTN